jgi:hypothetical protein
MSAEETNKQTNKRLQLRFSVQALLAAVTGQTSKGDRRISGKEEFSSRPAKKKQLSCKIVATTHHTHSLLLLLLLHLP